MQGSPTLCNTPFPNAVGGKCNRAGSSPELRFRDFGNTGNTRAHGLLICSGFTNNTDWIVLARFSISMVPDYGYICHPKHTEPSSI